MKKKAKKANKENTTTMPFKLMINHPKLKAGLDFVINSNGTATAKVVPVDASGNPTGASLPAGTSVPAWVSSDPGLVVAPAADGMSAALSPAVPPIAVTGATLTISATLPDGTTKISGTSQGIDIVVAPATPSGFQVVLSTP